MHEQILIIDDDRKLCKLLESYLSQHNYKVMMAHDGEDGLRAIKRQVPDLVILDVMLPGKDGFQICREIRSDYKFPIIMLTARGEVTDRIVGLELGADDYLPKPFEPRELIARMQAVLRRGTEKNKKEIQIFGKLKIDFSKRSVTLDAKNLELTATEFDILSVFAKYPGKALNRDQILEKLKGLEWEPMNRSIDVLMSRLRQKLGDDPKQPTYFKTLWGAGYMFIGEEGADEHE